MREKEELATKYGIIYGQDKVAIKGDPAYVRPACEASLKRLEVDCIDLYYQHRIDTSVPIEVTVGELKKLVEEGKIKYIGLSEASSSTIRSSAGMVLVDERCRGRHDPDLQGACASELWHIVL